MPYIDGFVIPVPAGKLDAYKRISRKAGKVWMEYGALEYRECVGDDLNTKVGTPFKKMTGARRNETVMFSWILYKSKAHRDRVNKKVMADPRIKNLSPDNMPFDCSRMAWGGFKTIVDM